MTVNTAQPHSNVEHYRSAPALLRLAALALALISLLCGQQVLSVKSQIAGGGSIRDFRRPANPPVHREPTSEAGGGRVKARAIDNPQITAGSQPSASETAGGGSIRSKNPKTTTRTASGSKILDAKSGGGGVTARSPFPPDRAGIAAAPKPTQTFDTVEDALEAGNSARDQKPADYRTAESAYRAATTLAPDDERGFIGLGNTYYDQRDLKQAVVAYQKAVELNPKNFMVFESLASVYYELGQYKEALDAAGESLRRDQGRPGPYFTLTWASLTNGDGQTAGNMAKAFVYRWKPFFAGEPPYYVTFAGYIGFRDAGLTDEANKLLATAPASNECEDKNWVCRLLKYLRHDVSAAELLKEATDNGKMTEAQTYIGVDLALSAKREEALPYLRWVVENGDQTFTEYALAKAWLKKLETIKP